MKKILIPAFLTVVPISFSSMAIVSCKDDTKTYTISWETELSDGWIELGCPKCKVHNIKDWNKAKKPKTHGFSAYRFSHWEDDLGKTINDQYKFDHSFAAKAIFEMIPVDDQFTINYKPDEHCHFKSGQNSSFIVEKNTAFRDVWSRPEPILDPGYEVLGYAEYGFNSSSEERLYWYLSENSIFRDYYDSPRNSIDIEVVTAPEGTKLAAFNPYPEYCCDLPVEPEQEIPVTYTTFTDTYSWDQLVDLAPEISADRSHKFGSIWLDDNGNPMEHDDTISETTHFDPMMDNKQEYHISYRIQGEGSLSTDEPIVAYEGEKFSRIIPDLPQALPVDKHVFEGWFLDDQTPLIPSLSIDQDFTIIAKFKWNQRIKLWLDTKDLDDKCSFDVENFDFMEIWRGTFWKEIKSNVPKFITKPGYKFSHWEILSQTEGWVKADDNFLFQVDYGLNNKIRPCFEKIGTFNISFDIVYKWSASAILEGETQINNIGVGQTWCNIKEKAPTPRILADHEICFAGWCLYESGKYVKLNDSSTLSAKDGTQLKIYANFADWTPSETFEKTINPETNEWTITGVVESQAATIEEIVIPKTIIDPSTSSPLPVSTIASNAFADCAALQKLYFDDNIYKIEQNVISKDARLKELGMPHSINHELSIGSGLIPPSFAEKGLSLPKVITENAASPGIRLSDEIGTLINPLQEIVVLPKHLKSIGRITPSQSKMNLLIVQDPDILDGPSLSFQAFNDIALTGNVIIPSSIEDKLDFIDVFRSVWPSFAHWSFYAMEME